MDHFDADEALDLIERERVTVLCCVSTQFIMMLNANAERPRDLSSLRSMFTGGEAVPFERAAAFEDVTGAKVLQFYGSNETGALSYTTVHDDREHRFGTAGRIIDDMKVRLLDPETLARRARGRAPGPARVQGPGRVPRLLGRRRGQQEAVHRRRLDADGRHRRDRRRRLPVGGRAHVGLHHPGRQEHQRPGGRGRAGHPPRRRHGGRGAVPRPGLRRAGVRLRRAQGRCRDHARGAGRPPGEPGRQPEWYPERLVVVDALPRSSGGKVAKGDLRDDAKRRAAELAAEGETT